MDADLLSSVRAQIGVVPTGRIGVAVSGGGDSVALLHILSRCLQQDNVCLMAATVDHGLRPESASEAQGVAHLATSLGVAHSILPWGEWDGSGNLQATARAARYELLCEWAQNRDISTLVLGHTADDQAETVLMRLGRASGVDGLAAIPARRVINGVTFVRPMLAVTRVQLRDYLQRNDVPWVDDPSNDDTRYDRIKARQMLELLEPLGVTRDALADVAQNMAQAREALDWYCFLAARDMARVDAGNVVLDYRKFRTLPEETARRLLVGAICWINGAIYPPRRAAILAVMAALREGRGGTLGGCRAVCHAHEIWLCREHKAVETMCSPFGQLWDGRWQMTGLQSVECEVRALGYKGLQHCPDWRDTGRPEAALISSPSLWLDDELVAAPFAKFAAGCDPKLVEGDEGFFSSLLSH